MTDTVFIMIMAVIVVQRLVESFVPNRMKTPGTQVARWTWVGFCITYPLLIAGTCTEYALIHRPLNMAVSTAGLVLIAVRIWLKWWAMRSLWKYWSVHIEIRDSHRLVKQGPYRYMRHPAYLSNLMGYLGVALFANAYYTLVGVIVVYLPLNLTRLYLEESHLVKKFGEEYRQYKQTVWALLPLRRARP